MGIRSNKVGGDIKGKRERKCEFLERCLILKSLIKRKKKKDVQGKWTLGDTTQHTHSFFSKTSNWVLSAATPLEVLTFENSLNLTAKT